MVYVVVFAVLVFLAGLAVVAVVGWRTLKRVKALGRSVSEASRRIEELTEAIEEIKPAQPH